MEVKPGYKLTEVGVIPEDWDPRTFGHLYAEPSRNGIYKTSEFRGRGTRIVNMGEMFGFDFISDQEMSRVTLTTQELSVSGLQDGDLLFGRRSIVPAGAGKCSLVVSPAEPITFESSIIRVRLDKMEAHPRFYYYFFASPTGRSTISTIVSGTNVKGIRATELRELKIPLPTIAEQHAIAAALSDVDALLAALDRLIAKKRDIKQAAMQELLTGKRRLPGFNGVWDETALGQMGKCHRGVSYNPSADLSLFDTESTIRLLRSNNVQEARLVFTDMQYVDSNRVSDVQRLRPNDILICMANGSRNLVGKAGRFSADDGFEYTFGAFMGCFHPDGQAADPDFVFYLFQTEKYRAHITILLAGSSINNLTPDSVEALLISVPSDKAEQTAIAAVLSDMDAEIAALEARREKTRALKQGMMQELLTGRIRLV